MPIQAQYRKPNIGHPGIIMRKKKDRRTLSRTAARETGDQ